MNALKEFEEFEREFEREIKRLDAAKRRGGYVSTILSFLLAATINSAINFVFVALAAAGIAWLFGSDDPRSVAVFWGWLSVPFSVIISGITVIASSRNSV